MQGRILSTVGSASGDVSQTAHFSGCSISTILLSSSHCRLHPMSVRALPLFSLVYWLFIPRAASSVKPLMVIDALLLLSRCSSHSIGPCSGFKSCFEVEADLWAWPPEISVVVSSSALRAMSSSLDSTTHEVWKLSGL